MRYAKLTKFLLVGTTMMGTGGIAHAQTGQTSGTSAGTVISNQAQATYTVNGTPQTTNSNISTFVVDRKVNLTLVTDQATNTQVNQGQTAAVTTYRLTNLTNAVQDFILDPDQNNLSVGVLPGADNFDVTNIRAFADVNGNGVYDPAVDTRTFVDELAPDTSVAVFVVADIPNSASANLAFVSMHTIVAAGGTTGTLGAALTPTDLNLVNQDNEVDIIFADGDSDGAFAGDIARNGQARAYAAYEVGARNVDLTVTKSSRVITDNVNAINPKALPGAVVEYCLIVRNATLLTPATAVNVTDVVPANTTYVPSSIQIGAVGGATACLVNGVPEDDDSDDAAELDPYRGNYAPANRTMTATIPTLLGGTSVAVSFRVTIN
jgi:uncharacterized repeat protein (TIGR01451 family)